MSASKTADNIAPAARILLGLIYLFFGLNYFFHFLPGAPPDAGSKAGAFLGALFNSGYFFLFLKTIETIFGILLLIDWFAPLITILIFPVSLNILLFHVILAPAPQGLVISFSIIILNIFLAWTYRDLYGPLVKRNHSLRTSISGNEPGGLSVIS